MEKYAKYYIDSHVHITRNSTYVFNMPQEWVISAMEKYGIDFCLVSNADGCECDHNQNILPLKYQCNQVDTLIEDIAFARNYPGKIGIMPWICPLLQDYTHDFEKLVKENRDVIYGIKIHPYHSKTAPDDKRVQPYLELASELKIPVVSHTGGCEEASAKHLYNAAKEFQDIPFIMVHLELGSDNKNALDYLGKLDNLYGDTTWVSMDTTLEVIKRYGSEKILFGSDMPIDGLNTYYCNKKGEKSIYQSYFHELPRLIAPKDYANIMYKNASNLFKISCFSNNT